VKRGEPFASGIGVTVLLHAGAAVALVLGHGHAPPPKPAPEVMVARLVRLGKPRLPDHLPRKPAAPPPAPVAVPPTTPETSTAPPVVPKPTEAAPAPTDRPAVKPADLRSAMARARALAARNAPEAGAEEPEGRPEGTPEGTADTASEGDPYATEVWRRIHDGWRVPQTVPSRDLPRLRALVFLRLADDGRIIEHRVVEPSGNRFFDASTIEAVLRVDRLPPPPAARAKAILESGILLEFSGTEAR